MAIDGIDQTRAQAVLTLISSDNNARERFIATCTGRGDAIEVLRRAADDTPPAALDALSELHRRAFGRTHTPAEENAATDALAALASAEADRTADSAALGVAIAATEEWAASRPAAAADDASELSVDKPQEVEPTQKIRRWVLRPFALASVILGSIAVGALATALWTNAADTSSTPGGRPGTSASPHGGVANVVPGTDAIDGGTIKASGPGSFTSAEEWFQKPAKTGDAFPSADLIDGLKASSTRLVGGTPKNLSLWVGKTDDDRLCLIMSVPSAQGTIESVTSCANSQQFDAMGLGLHTGGYQAVWTGPTISVFFDLTQHSD